MEYNSDQVKPSHFRVTVAGASMAPTLEIGETVEVCWVHRRPRSGEIVLLEGEDGELTCHRVLLSTGPIGLLVHRGDAPGAFMGVARSSKPTRVVHTVLRDGRTVALARRVPSPKQQLAALRLILTRALTGAARRMG